MESGIKHYAALDGWRGICAVLVVLTHFPAYSHIFDIGFVRYAYLFVDFFFVLSGFIISNRYYEAVLSGLLFREFIVPRIARLYPAHVLTLALAVAFELLMLVYITNTGRISADHLFSGETAPHTIIYELLMIHGLGITENTNWNGPSWSISTEFYTYIAFFFLAVLLRRRLHIAALIMLLAIPVYIAARSPTNMAAVHDFALVRCLCGFFAGFLAYRVVSHRPDLGARYPNLLEIIAAVAPFAFVEFARMETASVLSPAVFLFCVIIFAGERGFISRTLRAAPFAFLGALSYSVYMLHNFTQARVYTVVDQIEQFSGLRIMEKTTEGTRIIIRWFDSAWAGDAAIVAMLGLVIFASWIMHRVVEVPLRRFINRFRTDDATPVAIRARANRR